MFRASYSCDGFPLILSDVKMSSLKPTCLETPSLPKIGGEHSFLKKSESFQIQFSELQTTRSGFPSFI